MTVVLVVIFNYLKYMCVCVECKICITFVLLMNFSVLIFVIFVFHTHMNASACV